MQATLKQSKGFCISENKILSAANFDLEFLLDVGEEYITKKNGKTHNIYETEYQDVPISTQITTETQSDDQFEVDDGQFTVEEAVVQAAPQYFSSLIIPEKPTRPSAKLPEISLKLAYVSGYNCLESTNNVFYLHTLKPDDSAILYCAATLGVVMNMWDYSQKYFGVHGESTVPDTQNQNTIYQHFHKFQIVSICYDKQLGLAATGSMGINPEICIWRTADLAPVHKFYQGKGTKAVSMLHFAHHPKGTVLISIERASRKFNYLKCWSLEGKLLLDSPFKVDGSVYGLTANYSLIGLATDRGGSTFKLDLASGTAKLELSSFLKGFMTSVGCIGVTCVFGSSSGELILDKTIVRAHLGNVVCIKVVEDRVFSSGGNDRLIKVHNKSLTEQLCQVQLEEYARSIDVKNSSLLLSLRNGRVVQIQLPQSKDQKAKLKVIKDSHISGQLCGLCYDRINKCFVSVGEDNTILAVSAGPRAQQPRTLWRQLISQKQQRNRKYELNRLNYFVCSQQSRAADISKCLFAYVTGVGDLHVRHYANCQAAREHRIDQATSLIVPLQDKAECLKFSKNGKLLAVGSRDECIYLFRVEVGLQAKISLTSLGVLSGHYSYVVSLDFSQDNSYLRSCGAFGQLRYWDLKEMSEIILNSKHTPQSHKDNIRRVSAWQSMAKFCYDTGNLWKEVPDFDFVNQLKVSQDQRFVALGQDTNNIRIYNNPIATGVFRKFRGHASHVQNVCWSSDGKYLASVGGLDHCMMIWEIIKQ